MKKIVYCGMAAAVVLMLMGCDVLNKPAEEAPQYDAYGNRLVSLTINVGGAGRALTNILAKAGADYFEVAFKHPTSTGVYIRTNWTKSQTGKISVPFGDYNDASKAILFAGTAKNKTLLGIGLLTDVNGISGTIIDIDTTDITFTMAGLESNITNSGNTSTFKITTPNAYETTSTTVYKTAQEKDDSGTPYPVPIFMVPSNFGITATFTLGITNFANYKKGMYVPTGASGEGKLESIGVTAGSYMPISIAPGTITLTLSNSVFDNPDLVFAFTTPIGDGFSRIFFSQPVYALYYEPGVSVDWNIRGGLNNDILDGGHKMNSIGGSILLGVGAVNPINIIITP